MNGSRVPLPPEVEPPFEVYVNGLPQVEGMRLRLDGRELVFARELTAPARTRREASCAGSSSAATGPSTWSTSPTRRAGAGTS